MRKMLRFILFLLLLALAAGAVAVMFIDIPPPTERIEKPAALPETEEAQ